MDLTQYLSPLHFTGQKAEKIGPRIEQMVRQELGSPVPLPYQVLPGTSGGATAGSLLSEWAHAQIHLSQQAAALFYIHFTLAAPRPFDLHITIMRHGMGALAGQCIFAVRLSKPVPGPLNLGELKLMGTRGFSGDPALAARLNSQRDVLAKAYGLVTTTSSIGGTRIHIAHYLQIQPARVGSLLIVHRLPQSGPLSGTNWGIRDMLAFAPMLEYYL